MAVDFEERVDFDRLRTYRLARAREALNKSDLGALLLFDLNNIRYVTSTAIGEWTRDKMTRYALLTRRGEPMVWDFGSAAKHHRLYCNWLEDANIRAGLNGLRGAIQPEAGLFERCAKEIASLLRDAGVANMPLGIDIIEPPLWFELEKQKISIRDGQQVMHDAREMPSSPGYAKIRSSHSPPRSSTILAQTTSSRSTPSPANAAIRIRTISRIASFVRAIKPFSTS
jgi:Xaa-Pro dipeptidase